MDLWVALAAICAILGVLGAVAYFRRGGSSASSSSASSKKNEPPPALKKSAGKAEEETDSHLPHVVIYYGSQTGTAENLAKSLVKEGREKGFRAKAVDLEHWSAEKTAAGGVAVFLMATYGEGDPTDNAVDFMKWLKAAAPSTSLPPSFKFTVFGLGNRQYEHYNKMGKLVNEKLELAGGTRVYRHGEGDDDGNLEEDFDAWRSDGLWTALHAAASHAVGGASAAASGAAHAAATGVSHGAGSPPSPAARTVSSSSNSSSGVSSSPAPLPWKLVPVPAPSGIAVAPGACAPLMPPTPAHLASAASADLTSRHFFTAVPVRVHSHRELRQAPGVGFSTLHVELDLDGTGLSYRTADTAHVLPENDPALVEAVARWLNYKLDDWFTLEPRGRGATAAGAGGVGGAAATGGATADDDDDDDAAPSPLFPTPTSVRTALTRYVDLSGLPRKDLLLALAPHAKLAEDRKRLLHLGGREGKADWAAWAIAQERSVAELFSEFPSLAPPLEAFLQLAPRLQPRPYTIASSNVVAPSRVALCASVLDSPKPGPDGRRRLRGVCSNTFARVMAEAAARSSSVGGGTTRAAARQQQQQQPAHDSCAPLLRVLIRPSTFHLPADASRPIILVGPGTGVAPMRAFCQEREALRAAGVAVGPTVMFFGCRKRSEDYVYRDEIAGWAANGTLSALHVAFSRDAEQKVYVQHLLEQQGAAVWKLIADRGHVYVCGATRMGHDVAAAFERVFQAHGGHSPEGAAALMQDLHASGRYIVELWS